MNEQNRYLLLQVNDALFPIGGYSHSYGLETYIQKGLVDNALQAEHYIHQKLKNTVLYTDLLTVRLAYEYAGAGDLEKLDLLDQLTEAGKVPTEIREASKKLGSRFMKTVRQLDVSYASPVFEDYVQRRGKKKVHHTCIYGVFCAAAGISEDDCLSHYLYAQTSAMVTNSVKSIPLSQTDGQKILQRSFPLLEELETQVMSMGEEMLNRSAPGFDIRCMQHEALYSRIYMS
ncbi:MAG: urease accessory protein UreF [Eubacteriaceae bacterium]|jgi:urease accessory protein